VKGNPRNLALHTSQVVRGGGRGRGLAKLDLLHLLHLPVGLFSLTARHRIEFLGHVSFPGLLAVGEAGLAGRGAFVGCAGVYALEVGP